MPLTEAHCARPSRLGDSPRQSAARRNALSTIRLTVTGRPRELVAGWRPVTRLKYANHNDVPPRDSIARKKMIYGKRPINHKDQERGGGRSTTAFDDTDDAQAAATEDLPAAVAEPVTPPHGGAEALPAGFHMEMQPRLRGTASARESGLARSNAGHPRQNRTGTIDADYRGESTCR